MSRQRLFLAGILLGISMGSGFGVVLNTVLR